MKRILVSASLLFSSITMAGEYTTPSCYQKIPTSCSYNDMTLSLCNEEGKNKNIVFLSSNRIYVTGGNKFGSADGRNVCTVKGIKGTDPKRYTVAIK